VENRITAKTIKVQDKSFQIHKTDARTACWLFSYFASKSSGMILSGLGSLTKSEFDEIQSLALKQVFTLDTSEGNTFPISIISPRDGSIIDKDLAEDPALLFHITSESLLFQLAPFLVAKKESTEP